VAEGICGNAGPVNDLITYLNGASDQFSDLNPSQSCVSDPTSSSCDTEVEIARIGWDLLQIAITDITHYMQELMFLYGYIYANTDEVCGTPARSCENIYNDITLGQALGQSYQFEFTKATKDIPTMLSNARMNSDTIIGNANGYPLGPDGGPGTQDKNYNCQPSDSNCIYNKYTGGGYNYVQYQWNDQFFSHPQQQLYYYYDDGLTGKTFPTVPYNDLIQNYQTEISWDMNHWSYNTTVNVTGEMMNIDKVFGDSYTQNMINMCQQVYEDPEKAMSQHLETLQQKNRCQTSTLITPKY